MSKMLPPHNVALRQLSREEGISEGTLSRWRSEARAQGKLLPDGQSGPDGWTSCDKFAAVVETAALNEAEVSAYCRERGLYPEQIPRWREACERANDWDRTTSRQIAKAVFFKVVAAWNFVMLLDFRSVPQGCVRQHYVEAGRRPPGLGAYRRSGQGSAKLSRRCPSCVARRTTGTGLGFEPWRLDTPGVVQRGSGHPAHGAVGRA